MLSLARILLLVALSSGMALAQDECKFGYASPEAADGLIKALHEAKSCHAAATTFSACQWGSSADTQFAPIVISKCEQVFYKKLSPKGKHHYDDDMQFCAYKYSFQQGTMYMSAAAACQVGVAEKYAAHPELAEKPEPRASFNCEKAHTPMEKAICSDISLGHADMILSEAYNVAMKDPSTGFKSALELNQRNWLQNVTNHCPSASPNYISCLRNQFEKRFTSLDGCLDNGDGYLDCLNHPDNGSASESSSPAYTQRASFDCENPKSAMELVICADSTIGQADIKLSETYRDASAALSTDQRKQLATSERNWLTFVNHSCPMGVVGGIPPLIARGCVKSAIEVRTVQIQSCLLKQSAERTSCLNNFQILPPDASSTSPSSR